VKVMSEADHHSQALHAHRHGTHHSTLNHSLGHGQPADSHEMHAHTQADANVQAHGEAHAQGHIDANNVHGYHVRHRHPIQQIEENGAGLEEHEDDPDEEGLDEAEMQSDSGHQDVPPQVLAVRSQESTQLTLSYQGEVYVFDTVPPEKVFLHSFYFITEFCPVCLWCLYTQVSGPFAVYSIQPTIFCPGI
jgi:hypothetical protein